MKEELLHCKDCLAYYSKDVHHACPPWLKMLVEMRRESENKE